MENNEHHEPRKISYQFLKQITNDFHEERILGRGGFATVYKGVYENGGEIAVKILHSITGPDDLEFYKEFNNVRGRSHPNIAELVGFCKEADEELAVFEGKQVVVERLHMALCFEYVHNGSLHNFISDENTGFNWGTRYKIIKGLCEGLKYLHEGSEYPIMHLDLKIDNILLDKDMVPKIIDFGLSQLFGEESARRTLSAAGTIGYFPPEYIKYQIVSKEFDIFSMGAIIVRIMMGYEAYSSIVVMTTQKCVKHVHERWMKKLHGTMSDLSLDVYCNQVKRCIRIALNCLKSNRQERPNIHDIVSILNETETMIRDHELKIEKVCPDDPGQSIIPSNSRITSRLSSAGEPMAMTFQELHHITDGFSENRLLGKGGFGTVYKGVFDNGEVIAVKTLHDKPELVEDQFKNELMNLMTVKHENIIRLVGYCSEAKLIGVEHEGRKELIYGEQRALCLEYLQGGNLEELLSDKSCDLDWDERYRIIRGICLGLKHLHTGSNDPIYHLDLKPANILLDSNRIPKIGDFGLSRLRDSTETFVTQSYSGTNLYMPPEYMHRQQISSKFDVFSLGVIMIQIIAGPDGYYNYKCLMSPEEFIDHVTENWSKRVQEKTMSPEELLEIQSCIKLALRCVKGKQAKRPSITDIVDELNMISKCVPFDADTGDESTLAALSNS